MTSDYKLPETEYEHKDFLKNTASEIYILSQLMNFLDDEKIEEMMDRTLYIINRPMIPKEKAAALVVQFQAMALYSKSCGLSYGYNLGDPTMNSKEKANRKGIYNSLSEQFDRMAQSLKYLVNL